MIKHRVTLATFIGLFFSTLVSTSATAEVEHSVGIARSDKTGDIHYVEHHQYLENGDHRIEYYSPDLETLMLKKLSYPSLPQHPRIEQTNFVTNKTTLVEPIEGQFRMVVEEDDERDENFVARGPDVVCDAGFDTYIKSEWSRLLENEKTTVDFAVAGRSSTLAMKLTATPLDDDTTGFTIEAKNFVVRMFLPKIELAYRNSDRKLMRYHGLSNLNATSGDRKVSITFDHYATEDMLDKPMAQWLPEEIAGRRVAMSAAD